MFFLGCFKNVRSSDYEARIGSHQTDGASMIIFLTVAALLVLVFLLKNEMTCNARLMCIDIDFDAYNTGPSYDEMFFNPLKWTFAQHYPELAKRGKA